MQKTMFCLISLQLVEFYFLLLCRLLHQFVSTWNPINFLKKNNRCCERAYKSINSSQNVIPKHCLQVRPKFCSKVLHLVTFVKSMFFCMGRANQKVGMVSWTRKKWPINHGWIIEVHKLNFYIHQYLVNIYTTYITQ